MDSLARTDRIKKIADLNDAFRTSLAGGRVVVTSGVAALGHRTQVDALRAVQAFTAFTPDNDPYGEHDFGFFKVAGHEFFWKIDYYDPSLTRHSDDAADPVDNRPGAHDHADGGVLMVRPPRPAMQGDLDGLCGVYSIVNAVQWALHTCTTTAWAFGQAPKRLIWSRTGGVVRHAGDRTWPAATTRHLRHRRHQLFRADAATARQSRMVVDTPKRRSGVPATILPAAYDCDHGRVLARLREHLAAPGSAAIIAVEAHWTVVRGASNRRVRVLDSGGWMFMTISSKAHRGAGRNGFQPSSVFLLRLSPETVAERERL